MSSVGHASTSSNSTSVTISTDDCARAKECCTKAVKYGAAATCFGLGYGTRSLYDAFTSGANGCHRDDDYSSTTVSPFRDYGNTNGSIGNWNDSWLDKLNQGKIH